MNEVSQFKIKALLQACLHRWVWFAVSLAAFTGSAVLWVATREPVYERSEQILVNKQDSGGGVGEIAESFASLGLVANNTDVNNELIAITSPAVLWEVVRILGLDVAYSVRGPMHRVTLYGTTLPVTVRFDSLPDTQGARMRLTLMPGGAVVTDRFELRTAEGKKKLDYEVKAASLPVTLNTPLGPVTLLPGAAWNPAELKEPLEIKVVRSPTQTCVEDYADRMSGDLVDPDADVIELTVKDVCVERAEDILRTTLEVYNRNWIDDKNRMAVATSAFIDDRLRVIEAELGGVDAGIAARQSETATGLPEAASELSLRRRHELEETMLQTRTQLQMSQFMKAYLTDPANARKVVPLNTGTGSTGFEAEMARYNELLLARDNLEANSSASNPLVQAYGKQLDGLHAAMVKSVDTHIEGLEKTLAALTGEHSRNEGQISSLPVKSLPLLTEGRQQKVLESLYLFLLQKREENELSQKFTADNVRVITPPMGSLRPVSPRKALIVGVAVLLGLLVPLGVMYVSVTSDTKVRSRSDLESLPVPFAGEIPKADIPGRQGRTRKKKGREEAPPPLVAAGSRDVVNEAFRVVRSNLGFMAAGTPAPHTVLLTSVNPGSGKSFVALNLALAFAVKGERVLLADCDLRHGSTSLTVGSPRQGLAQWLGGTGAEWKPLIKAVPGSGVDILPAGSAPPNPAELLENGRLARLIAEAGACYDWIFLDAPPVDIVVDTQSLAPLATATLFVVRAGMLEKEALADVEALYRQQRLPRMSVLLNATDTVHSRYHAYGPYANQ